MRRLRSFAVTAFLVTAAGCDEGPSDIRENTAPSATLLSPAANLFFSGGDELAVEISGDDAQDGELDASALSWWVILHHATHTHPYVQPTVGKSGTVPIARAGHVDVDIFLRVHARAVDSQGMADTVWGDVHPRVVSLELATEPPALQLTVDGQPHTTPTTLATVAGMERSLDAPSPQSSDGTSYAFESWSHGGDSAQVYAVPPEGASLTATFTSIGAANEPPSVSLVAPSDGATLTVGIPVTLTAEADDSDGTVTTVEFREGTTVLGADDTAPYTLAWTPETVGTYTLLALATDDAGATTTSAPTEVTVQASGGGDVVVPTATLTSPEQGTEDLTGSVTLTAEASDDVGVILVEFQIDGEVLATDGTDPYQATLPSTSAYTTGAHTFRARAQDAAGNWSAWSTAAVTFGGNVELPSGFTRTTVASGFTGDDSSGYLTAAAFAPDGRLLVLEQRGTVHVIRDGAMLPTPLLDLPVASAGEQGLLGIALHPDFDNQPWVYLYYTSEDGGYVHNRISRFTVDGDTAVSESEDVLVELDELTGGVFHNGGAMAFGSDDKLYVAVGDNRRSDVAQSLSSRFGKILRYNPDGTIPDDNPFWGSTSGADRAIWAMGLRNPYTFAFQPGTGRMHINDVGEDRWEEINLGSAGGNFGWPATEGPTDDPAYETPLLAYAHSDSPTLYEGSAIVGSAFYDPAAPTFGEAYEGDYFFADYVAGWIYRMDSDEWDTAYAFAQIEPGITNLVVGPDGALYILVGTRVDRISR